MKKILLLFASITLVCAATEALGEKKKPETRAQREWREDAEKHPDTEKEKPLRTKWPDELVLYKIGSVECSVISTGKSFIFRADNEYGYSGRTIHQVEVDFNRKVLSNKNYIFHREAGEWIERPTVYPVFYSQCFRGRVQVLGNREFPDAVEKIIGGPERGKILTVRPSS